MYNKKPIIIQEAENNFEWFQYIIKGITNEIFEDTDYNTIWEFEQQLLDILSKSYSWQTLFETTKNIFSIERMSNYIRSDKEIVKNFCPLYINEECQSLISYINIFSQIRLEKCNISFLQMWKTLQEIEKNFKKEISKYDYFENVSDYIWYIDKNIFTNFYPETLKKKLENLWVDKKDINMICSSVQDINENNLMLYINSVLSKSYILDNKKNHVFSIRKKVKEDNIEIEREIKMIILLYIDKSKKIHTKPINPEYIESECKVIKDNYGHVFILQKPLLPIT